MALYHSIQDTINLRAQAEGSPEGASQKLRDEIRELLIPRLGLHMQNLNWNADDYTQAFRNWYSWRVDLVVWETICK